MPEGFWPWVAIGLSVASLSFSLASLYIMTLIYENIKNKLNN